MSNTEINTPPKPNQVWNDNETNNAKELEDVEDSFSTLLEKLGSDGTFYTRYNILYNIILLILVALPHFNYILAMYVPDHSCHVPGGKLLGYSQKEWKNLTIPK